MKGKSRSKPADSFQCIDPRCAEAGTYHDHPKKRGDRVFTPAWVAKDMVDHFIPATYRRTDSFLDPCKGDAAFMRVLPKNTDWCEIEQGRDFFEWDSMVDWVVGNPPYSMTREWFRHSYKIAQNLLYLVPLRNVFSGFGFVREIYDFGGIVEIRHYGTGGSLGFPMGNAVGAFHIQHDYRGPCAMTFATVETKKRKVSGST